MTDKKYINGVFITELDGKYGEWLSFGITDEGIEELRSLPKNEKGVRNFAAFRRKNDNRKFNPMWPKEGKASAPPAEAQRSSYGNYLPPREQDAPPVSEKDLPF